MSNDLRKAIAKQLHVNTRVSRADIFGADDERLMPIGLRKDARLMQPGYVGTEYRPGGVVFMAINPGGGGDTYVHRTPDDEQYYPPLYAFAREELSLEQFETITTNFRCIVQRWSGLWRLICACLNATGTTLDEVAYLNAVPYRTKNNANPRVVHKRNSWKLVTGPTLELLRPSMIVALGRKAEDVLDRFYQGEADLHILPRTNGDRYVSKEAQAVLAQIRASAHKPSPDYP